MSKTDSIKSKALYIQNVNEKRIKKFINDIQKNKSEFYEACPSEENINVWYVKIKNLAEEYEGGVYYMKIHFTEKYPFEPPDYFMLTPSGRFQINSKICLSNSGYHSESWSALWGINQIIMGMISFFYERKSEGISHVIDIDESIALEYIQKYKNYDNMYSTANDRKQYAKKSVNYNKKHLADIEKLFI